MEIRPVLYKLYFPDGATSNNAASFWERYMFFSEEPAEVREKMNRLRAIAGLGMM